MPAAGHRLGSGEVRAGRRTSAPPCGLYSLTKRSRRMPKIIVQAHPDGDGRGQVTLAERVVTDNLDSPHYTAQLLERLAWATADAEAIESEPPVADEAPVHRPKVAGVLMSAVPS